MFVWCILGIWCSGTESAVQIMMRSSMAVVLVGLFLGAHATPLAPPCAVVDATSTLAVAQAIARGYSTKGRCVEVHLEPRVYYVQSPLTLTAADSNTMWVGVDGSEVTTGVAVPPSAWTPSPTVPGAFDLDSTHFVNSTAYGDPTAVSQLTVLVQVGVDGTDAPWRPLHLARWPNVPFVEGAAPPFNWSTIASVPNKTCTDDCTSFTWAADTDRPSQWVDAATQGRLFVHGFLKYMWRDTRSPIDRVDTATRVLASSASLSASGVVGGGVWYAYNLIEELDTEGEFVLNRTDGVVSAMLPLSLGEWGGCVQNGAVVCKTRLVPATPAASSDLFQVIGAQNVTFRGVAMSGCKGIAVNIQGSANVTVDQCTITNVGTGVSVNAGGPSGAGSTGVMLQRSTIGYTALMASTFSGGNRTTLTAPNFTVENCHFHNFGAWVYTYQAGVHLSGVGTTVRKNLFRSSYHVAILYGGNDHVIELNEFHHVVTITYDSGAIYAGRDLTSRGTVIRHNLFHHLETDAPAPSPCNAATSCIRQAIYIDDYESDVNITGNIFFAMENGFFSNKGSAFNFANNLFYEVGLPIRQSGAATFRPGPPDGVDGIFQALHAVPFTGPLWSARYPMLASRYGKWTVASQPPPDSATPLGNTMHLNAVVNSTGPTPWETQHGWTVNVRHVFSLESKYYDPSGINRARFDVDSTNVMIADPHFASSDPGGLLNFTLRLDSPLYKLGWQTIPADDIGPTSGSSPPAFNP